MAHVLVVINEIGALTLTEIMLRRQGHTAVKVRTGEEALSAIQQQRFDMVVLHACFESSYEAGAETAQAILKADPDLPIALHHAPREQDTMALFSPLNIKAFLYMPVTPYHIDEAIRQHARTVES